jgi:uncharacterized protein YndB with AHSA1/START domain
MRTKPTQSLVCGLALLLLGAGFTGCATSGPAPTPSAAAGERINWPADYEPANATFFVHNEIEIKAPPAVVWDILIEAETWPEWYEGAQNLKVKEPAGGRLAAGAVFTWRTMGLNLESRVREFEPPHRLAWESRRRVIRGYHAWLIIPTAEGCWVVTDESFHGFLASMQKIFIPKKLLRLHDIFLVELKKKAEARHEQEFAK